MAKPPLKSVEEKTRIVLAVLRGEVSIAEGARRPWPFGGSLSERTSSRQHWPLYRWSALRSGVSRALPAS
jgi:hypothetical protein